jgi:hypothetical protein
VHSGACTASNVLHSRQTYALSVQNNPGYDAM